MHIPSTSINRSTDVPIKKGKKKPSTRTLSKQQGHKPNGLLYRRTKRHLSADQSTAPCLPGAKRCASFAPSIDQVISYLSMPVCLSHKARWRNPAVSSTAKQSRRQYCANQSNQGEERYRTALHWAGCAVGAYLAKGQNCPTRTPVLRMWSHITPRPANSS